MRYIESSIFFIIEREIIQRHLRVKEKCVDGDKKSVTWHVSPDQQPPVSGGAQKQVTINFFILFMRKTSFCITQLISELDIFCRFLIKHEEKISM